MLELTKLKSHSEIELGDKLEDLKQNLRGLNKYKQLRKAVDKNYRSFSNIGQLIDSTALAKNAL